jgi:hypothetical protein
MEHASKKLGGRPNLTSAITAFVPRDPKRVVVDHPFKREFLITPLTGEEARPYVCDKQVVTTGSEYVGAAFQFRISGGGALGLLWGREQNHWKLVSFQPLAP